MPFGRGALVRLLFQRELVYRTPPAAAAKVLPHTSWGVERDARRQANATVNGSRLASKTDAGDPVVGGPFSSILDLRSIGNWLMLAFGVPTAGKAVTKQPTNVTGVTVHYASGDCTAGDGTLAYVAAATTLAWNAQGALAGAAVDVSAGGNFTLESQGGGKSIRITVVADLLPVGNQNDADIAVSNTLKAHSFLVTTDELPSALFEAQHSDLAKYYRTVGAKLGSLSLGDLLANEQNISGQLIAAAETEEVAAFDANPTAYAAVRACAGKGRVNDGAAGLGKVIEATCEINENLAGYPEADGLDGYGCIDEGELMISGQIRTKFDSAGAYALARAGTSTRLHLESGAVVGADIFKLVIDALNVELTEKAPPKEGKSGLFVTNGWRVHYGTYVPEIYLINDVAAY